MARNDGEGGATIGCILVFAAIPFLLILRGWAAVTLWAWFVIPTFGAAPLSIPAAIGLAIFLEVVVPTASSPKERDKENDIAKAFLGPFLLLAIGWIVRGFI